MRDYFLFYDNHETGRSGYLSTSVIGGEQAALDTFFWAFGDSINPLTTLTLVER